MLLVALRTWAYLVVVISSLITAYNLDQELGPPGPLGVSLDYQFATSGSHDPARPFLRNWVFNSHIIFNQDVSTITDGQLVQIAIDAYGEIDAVQKQYQLNKGKTTPRVMSILAFDSEIILVSSQKGSASFMTDFGNSKVRDSLQRCELMYANTASTILQAGHKNGASCGEVMAAHLFYQMYPEKNLADMKAVEVSIASHALDEDKSKSLQVLDPCPGRVEVSLTTHGTQTAQPFPATLETP